MFHRWRLVFFVAVLTVVVAAVGCWDRNEVEELGIVLAIAVKDMPGEGIQLVAQLANPRLVGGAGVSRETPGASIAAK